MTYYALNQPQIEILRRAAIDATVARLLKHVNYVLISVDPDDDAHLVRTIGMDVPLPPDRSKTFRLSDRGRQGLPIVLTKAMREKEKIEDPEAMFDLIGRLSHAAGIWINIPIDQDPRIDFSIARQDAWPEA